MRKNSISPTSVQLVGLTSTMTLVGIEPRTLRYGDERATTAQQRRQLVHLAVGTHAEVYMRMGQASGAFQRREERHKEGATSEVDNFPLMDVPEDILFEVLKWVPAKDIVRSCVYVCRQWKKVIDTQMFWKEKCSQDLGYTEEIFHKLIDESFKLLYFKRPYQNNLIKNPDASEGFNNWKIISNGGDRWKIEGPVGCDPVEQFTGTGTTGECKCWVSSYHSCSKVQIIDLVQRGCSEYILDEVRPNICVSELYAARFDCGIRYKIRVQVLRSKKDKAPITEWNFEDTKPAGRQWFKAEHVFSNYDPGARFIKYFHEGCDTQFWAGWYGAKITRSSIILDLTNTIGDSA